MGKKLVLGTSKWGESISEKEAHLLLSTWYWVHGKKEIDIATNYPINGKLGYPTAMNYLTGFLLDNPECDLDVTLKIGSVSREKVPDFDLSPEKVRLECDHAMYMLRSSLKCIMVHWDNREDEDEILSTLETIKGYSLRVGISGIKYPQVYAKIVNHLGLNLDVQVRYSNLSQYLNHFDPNIHRYYAYRVSEGFDTYLNGLKNALNDPNLHGVLIGATNIDQLNESLMCYVENQRQNHLQDDHALPGTLLSKDCQNPLEGSESD